MLGGKGPLRDMTEREGYTRVMLAIETLTGESFTISRSVDGLAFTLFDGLYSDAVPSTEGRSLAEKHNDKRDDNLSAFLLSKIGLTHKRIRKNKAGVTNSLSFRNLARLVIVDEEEIIQKRTPLGCFQRNGEDLVRGPVVTNVPTWRVCLQNADGPDPMVTELLAVENGAVEIERPPS